VTHRQTDNADHCYSWPHIVVGQLKNTKPMSICSEFTYASVKSIRRMQVFDDSIRRNIDKTGQSKLNSLASPLIGLSISAGFTGPQYGLTELLLASSRPGT